MQQFQEGVVFAGRYRIVRCIAAGGMGAVYEVVHLETQRRRALKVMLPHVLQSEELRERFKREASIAAQVESEFIVDVSDAGVEDATRMPYLVMELLRGEELGKRLARLGRLPPAEVLTYLRQTAIALDKTHQASVVHRDLKPENLYLTEDEEGRPRIKILDFGIAKLVAESATHANATRSLGTPLYMSPEQFLARPISGAADIYALGLLAYTFLVGVPYWAEEAGSNGSVVAFGMIAVHGPPERASVRAARRGVALPPAFDDWFAKATAVSPADRFPSASAAVAALAVALDGAPFSSAPPSSIAKGTLPLGAPRAAGPAAGTAAATVVLDAPAHSPPAGLEASNPGRAPHMDTQMGAATTGTSRRHRGAELALVTAALVVFCGAGTLLYTVRTRTEAAPAAPPPPAPPPTARFSAAPALADPIPAQAPTGALTIQAVATSAPVASEPPSGTAAPTDAGPRPRASASAPAPASSRGAPTPRPAPAKPPSAPDDFRAD